MLEKIQALIGERWEGINPKCQAVLYVICEHSYVGRWVTQEQIAASEKWLGHHPIHEEQLEKKRQSTLRQVRQLVRDIRLEYGIPVISSRSGYKLPATEAEARMYLSDLEREAKAQAAAWYRTYRAMSQSMSVQSSFFEAQKDYYNDN